MLQSDGPFYHAWKDLELSKEKLTSFIRLAVHWPIKGMNYINEVLGSLSLYS